MSEFLMINYFIIRAKEIDVALFFSQRDSIERYVVLCLIAFIWIDQVQTTGDKKQLEQIEEAHEEQKEQELEKRKQKKNIKSN